MQYVSFVPGMLVFTVDVRLTAVDPAHTSVEVTYARTALDAASTMMLRLWERAIGESGPQWQEAIEKCLNKPLNNGG